MNRVTEAQLTVPVTLALDPDSRGLIDAYAKTNSISVGEVIRRSISACLAGQPHGLDSEPDAALIARYQREQRRRGRRLTEAKRARQRALEIGE